MWWKTGLVPYVEIWIGRLHVRLLICRNQVPHSYSSPVVFLTSFRNWYLRIFSGNLLIFEKITSINVSVRLWRRLNYSLLLLPAIFIYKQARAIYSIPSLLRIEVDETAAKYRTTDQWCTINVSTLKFWFIKGSLRTILHCIIISGHWF